MGIKRTEEESSGQEEGVTNSTDTQKRLKSGDGVVPGKQQQLASFSEIRGKGLRFEATGGLSKLSFCSFVEENSEGDAVGFFREVVREMEETRGVLDFHLKVREQKRWWVEVYFGDAEKEGPDTGAVASGGCISCCPGAPLFPGQEPGVTAGECVLAEFSDQPHVQCSLDAKARAGFVITPVRHVERMSQLQDEELLALWSTAVRALRQDSLSFRTMILNHGTYRHTPHLHLKVWVDEQEHQQVRLKWSSEKLDLWNRLIAMVEITPKRPCRFFQERGFCRYGEKCRFSHIEQISAA